MMGDDPRLPAMPEAPTLIDFFKYQALGPRCISRRARASRGRRRACPRRWRLACSAARYFAVVGFIRGDHGYWGAQLVEPYIDEEMVWAIRAHQVLRFYPDLSVCYEYPQNHLDWFGGDYRPDGYIEEDYKRMRGTTSGTCPAG